MKKRLFYLNKINIAKVLVLSYIFIMSLFIGGAIVEAAPSVAVKSSTYTGNSNNNSVVVVNNIPYIQGSGMSSQDGITFEITSAYENIDDYTAIAIWEQGFSSSALEFEDYDRWYINTIACDDENYTACIATLDSSPDKTRIAKKTDGSNEYITYTHQKKVYYIVASHNNKNEGSVTTVGDFTKFFTDKKITYTYRIRNHKSANELRASFGFKEIYINFWKSKEGDVVVDDDVDKATIIRYGLAQAIDDVRAHTNYTNTSYDDDNPVACDDNKDKICIDYVDSNGIPSESTTIEQLTNIYIPNTVVYNHKYTTSTSIKDNYKDGENLKSNVIDNNTVYAINYFCEGTSIVPATITNPGDNYTVSCDDGELRKYLYVDSLLVGNDINSLTTIPTDLTEYFLSTRYNTTITVDTRGNYVVVIKDAFGNTNSEAIINVEDIINQAILAYFQKSNAKEDVREIDGWGASEYVTNQDVNVSITMSATTVIKIGLPIVEAQTTLLNQDYVKQIRYWRVSIESTTDYNSDICVEDVGVGCALKPSDAVSTLLYSRADTASDPEHGSDYVSFNENVITLKIASNGRYRFYIETFAGSNTDNDGTPSSPGNPIKGEQKNPRVEVYKIDKNAPEILFGGSNDSFCTGPALCSHTENTYSYYQGTGNTSGTVINKLATGTEASIKIDYAKKLIYYVSANGESSILKSANNTNDDDWYTYIIALFNSRTYINEKTLKYDNQQSVYSYSQAVGGGLTYDVVDTTLSAITDEEDYRKYILSNNIKYTAYSLATNYLMTVKVPTGVVLEQSNIDIEYLDSADGTTPICTKLDTLAVDLNNDGTVDQEDCVNYYLDHGIDFNIKVTSYDVVEELIRDGDGNILRTDNILGNSSTRTIYVDVIDTTAPGYNSLLNRYNVGTDCRVELGNMIGGSASQDVNMILNCYGVTTKTTDPTPVTTYNFEDNVFNNLYTQDQNINVRNNVMIYILSKETNKWVDLSGGYTPNRSGSYAMLIIIKDNATQCNSGSCNTVFNLAGETYHDELVANDSSITVSGNAIGVLVTYHVDKKTVLVSPKNNEKKYGEEDPIFDYCVSINKNTVGIREYLEAPFKDMSVFTNIGCAEYSADKSSVSLNSEDLEELFQGNNGKANFTGILTRQESDIYNNQRHGNTSNIINNYVGLYKIVLGSLTISGTDTDGYDLGEDYIVKIDPNNRSEGAQLNKGEAGRCNLVESQYNSDGDYVDRSADGFTTCYKFDEDDDYYVESKAIFTIKQTILNIQANGSSKEYGEADPNYENFNKNSTTDKILNSASAYLNGYSHVSGLVYGDTIGVVLGVLRRQVGEDVGVYSICNFRGTGILDTSIESPNNMLVLGGGDYTKDCSTLDLHASRANDIVDTVSHNNGILVIDGDYIASRALYIETNKTYETYKTLNVTTDSRNNNYANYVIKYQANSLVINPAKMIIQPTPGQRREYSYSGVDDVDPWEIIVYGEKSFNKSTNESFNGWTANSPIYSIRRDNDSKSVDTPDAKLDEEHYANASEVRAGGWKLIQGGKTYNGAKTNETYGLFVENRRLALVPNGVFNLNTSLNVYQNMNAGWYAFDVLDDSKSNLELIVNGRKQCTYADYITLTGTGASYTNDCRNYDLSLDLNYRTEAGYKNGDSDGTNTIEVIYKSKLGYCKGTVDVSDEGVQCSDDISHQILFEVYRREVILEFNSLLEKIPSNDAHMVYGYRYDYYKTNLFEIATNSANKNHLENFLFYCYPSYDRTTGLVGLASGTNTCTANPWYGLTAGDSWVNVGLEFHLHSIVSAANSDYYTTGSDKAIPAGRYYVYSTISNDAALNYKYNYLGGTMTIKTKTVGITITDYDKEYGNVYYSNPNCKIKDGSLLLESDSLIDDCLTTGTDADGNSINNTYGFTVNELDDKDVIADNFIGRPKRVSKINASIDINGLQENVGVYEIDDGSIKSKHNNSFNSTCTDNFIGDESNGCVVVGGNENKINNYMVNNDADYDLTYYLLKLGTEDNGVDYSYVAEDTTIINPGNTTVDKGALKIKPATIEITVEAGQTKMYGCAYNVANTDSNYSYSYADGYGCTPASAEGNDDLGYKYTVSGDKDYYIYNNGYYGDDYNFDLTYTTDRVNQIGKNEIKDDALLIAAPIRRGNISSALNGGVLYRVATSIYNNAISYSSIVEAANSAQDDTAPKYQGQSVGSYVITLGNLNATLTSEFANYSETNNMVCDANNAPGMGNQVCRNYIISYYGASSIEDTHTYDSENKDDLTFTITTRVAFIYAFYNAKVYGNDDPVVKIVCDASYIDAGVCHTADEEITLGITRYFTKFNSLAKAPYVASIEENATDIAHEYDASTNKDDKQVDVVTGLISRKGMNNGDKDKDDIVGVYNYIYDIDTTTYASNNYVLSYYYRTLDDGKIAVINGIVDEDNHPYQKDTDNYDQYMAVNENGTTLEVVDAVNKKVYFEINLRKIDVKLISFSKVYGIEDNSSFFNLGICATSDEVLGYDEKGNPVCSYATGKTSTEHGLSPSHKATYILDGTLNQALFKQDFDVRFVRSLGENVACPSKNVTATITGYFTNRTTEYTYDLGCKTYTGVGSAYEALGIINQSLDTLPGYNYEITYESGDMLILPRTIEVVPDSNQGFQYGSYTYPSLIPAITFTNKLTNSSYLDTTRKVMSYNAGLTNTVVKVVHRDGTSTDTAIEISSMGLVNGGTTRICLNNIDGTNKFCINDKQDTYDVDLTEKSTSLYTANENGTDTDFTTYVFGDNYQDETSTRSALNREIGGVSDQRYNRNVGDYTIVKGDLADKSGNYTVRFKEGVVYKVTAANITITPNASQSKIYGEADKELSFKVKTQYTINSTQYITYDSNIYSIVDENGDDVVIDRTQTTLLISKGSTVTLTGFAYYENIANADYNYGTIKNSNKSANAASVDQSDVIGSSFDKYCFNNNTGAAAGSTIDGCADQKVSYASTTKILVGYLYVTNYAQKAGTYKIANGFVISDNEFNAKNYDLTFVDDVDFVINKLDVNVYLNDISKNYGEASDSYKCDTGVSCTVKAEILTAQDNENMLEYNFDVSYKDVNTIIAEGTYDGENMVLLVNAINNNYYTQSEGKEDKNNFLGVSVIRKNNNATTCSSSNDKYGCEDAGKYDLYLRKYNVVLAETKDGSNRYDDNYNIMLSNVSTEIETLDNSTNNYVVVEPSTHTVLEETSVDIIKTLVSELEIKKRNIDIFVNTNLNTSEDANYYQIQQNIEVPSLPTVDNSYNLTGYVYDATKKYHGVGEEASSKSDDANLSQTYGKVVWGGQPEQVRTKDTLVGEVAYCNQARNGNTYFDEYPDSSKVCNGDGTLVYQANKAIVNTSTKDKFILITRNTLETAGLKIRPDALGAAVSDNDYENKNYNVTFYPGAVNVISDDKAPELVIGKQDYYIEANAFYDEISSTIIGSYSGADAILEYLVNGLDTNYILAKVNSSGNLYITLADSSEVVVSSSSLQAAYGVNNATYQGIVSGIEQALVYPFTSNYAHLIEAKADSKSGTYLNEKNITLLEELITTFIKWFDVDSYDNGQYLNGEYLPRKFDRYYYISINKNGYDIANDIDNEFAINKVGTYDVSFYVMDNAGQVSDDGNIGRLHIIDTTAPTLGELNLYSGKVKCDANCDAKDNWYINEANIRLSSFNRYKKVEDAGAGTVTFVLDPKGEYIFFTELGNDADPYKLVSDLRAESGRITTVDYVDYIKTSDKKYMAAGIVHNTWDSSPNGIYLTITGGEDNSYTVRDNSSASQWQHYYSLDMGNYWVSYETEAGMEGYIALISDGTRTIQSMTIDTGVSVGESGVTHYTFSYSSCYGNCLSPEVTYKVNIGATTYEFNDSDIQNRSFEFNAVTHCVVEKLGTAITCTENGTPTKVKLDGNRFAYKGNNYIILGHNVLTYPTHDFVAAFKDYSITLDNGVTYRYDPASGLLYREYIGLVENAGTKMTLEGKEYVIEGLNIKYNGATETTIVEETNSFTLDGKVYKFIASAGTSYYYSSESYKPYQNSFVVNGREYTFSTTGSISVGDGEDVITIKANKRYNNTYTLYDKYLKGLTTTYRDSIGGAASSLAVTTDMIIFTRQITENVAWNRASADANGTINEEMSKYLNQPVDTTKYYQDKKFAYLDTVAPLVGITMYDTANNVVRYGNGNKLFAYEYGYFNTTRLNSEKKYNLRGKVFTVDIDNLKVIDYENNQYTISITSDTDPNKRYAYVINYVTYYIDETVENVYWLPSYVESYVGAKDSAKGGHINTAEVPMYNLNASVKIGEIPNDTIGGYRLMDETSTNTNTASGIGSTEYKTSGDFNLHDFIYLGTYGKGIYYEDIDYIVSYVDPDTDQLVKVNLNQQFKACFDGYVAADGSHMITQDCAQAAIANVVRPRGNDREDITYDIYYVVRDKAGNASAVIAKGVIYATIYPSTNIVIQNIEPTPTNSGVVAASLGENTYSLTANQGVSLTLIEEAFSIDYVKTSTGKNYNNQATMTIYKNDRLVASDVAGVNFIEYVSTNEIAEYKIVYNLVTKHTPVFGDDITINGDEVTLYLRINSPKVEESEDITISDFIEKNETSKIGIALIMGIIFLSLTLLVAMILRKRR